MLRLVGAGDGLGAVIFDDLLYRGEAGMAHTNEEFIETVDVWHLRHYRMPILRVLAPDFTGHMELGGYLKRVLATGRWRWVRIVPHRDPSHPYPHLFDVYGERAGEPSGDDPAARDAPRPVEVAKEEGGTPTWSARTGLEQGSFKRLSTR